MRAPFPAWHALLALGVLHDGTSTSDAAGVLGPPTSRAQAHVEWYGESRMHVNPSLSADVRGDALFGFRVTMR